MIQELRGALGFQELPGTFEFQKLPGTLQFQELPGTLELQKLRRTADFEGNCAECLSFRSCSERCSLLQVLPRTLEMTERP